MKNLSKLGLLVLVVSCSFAACTKDNNSGVSKSVAVSASKKGANSENLLRRDTITPNTRSRDTITPLH